MRRSGLWTEASKYVAVYLTPGVQQRQFSQGPLAAAELVAGDAAAVAGEGVVQAEPELDEEGAAFLGLAVLLVGQETQRRREDPGEGAENRNGGLQRLDVVGCDPQEAVAFHHGFPHEAELAVFEVADAAVDHVRGCAAGALAVVAALHERHVDALQGQIAEGADPVDAASDDQHTGVGALPQVGHGCTRCAVRCTGGERMAG